MAIQKFITLKHCFYKQILRATLKVNIEDSKIMWNLKLDLGTIIILRYFDFAPM